MPAKNFIRSQVDLCGPRRSKPVRSGPAPATLKAACPHAAFCAHLQFFARSRYAAISGNTRQYADAGQFPCRVLPPDSSPVAAYSPARAAQNRVTAPRVWSSPERFRGSLSWPRARSLASRAFRFNCQRTVRKKIYASICVDKRRKATVSDATRRILTPRMPFLAHSGASNRPKATLSASENFGRWALDSALRLAPGTSF
jgi:hypothetical protein